MSEPLVAINLPVYNGAETLRRQIDSILNQTFGDFRLYISDNASNDGSSDICREYLNDHRVNYYRNIENIGFDLNFKRGLYSGFESEFLIYASANDFWEPRYLEECVKALNHNPEASLAYSYCWLIKDGQRRLYQDSFDLCGKNTAERLTEVMGKIDLCTAFYGLMRSRFVRQNEAFLYALSAGNDNLLLNAMAISGPFVQLKEPLFNRERPSHEGLSLSDRRIAVETINRRRHYIPCFPFLNHMRSCLRLLQSTPDFDFQTKNALCDEIVQISLTRSLHHIEAEIKTAVDNMVAGRMHTGFSGDTAYSDGLYQYIDYFTRIVVVSHLEDAKIFLPYPPPSGLHLGLAICYIGLSRYNEAMAAVGTEMEICALHKDASSLKYAAIARQIAKQLSKKTEDCN